MPTSHHTDLAETPKLIVKPGHIFVTETPAIVSTVLGSGVATCVWDRELRWGGLNHFSRPVCPRGEPTTARYGNVAVQALVKMMVCRGSRRDDLVAQLFGGGTPDRQTAPSFGEENIRIARKMLQREGIRIVSEDVGGSLGRKVAFDTKTGQVAILKVHRLRDSDWQGVDREP